MDSLALSLSSNSNSQVEDYSLNQQLEDYSVSLLNNNKHLEDCLEATKTSLNRLLYSVSSNLNSSSQLEGVDFLVTNQHLELVDFSDNSNLNNNNSQVVSSELSLNFNKTLA